MEILLNQMPITAEIDPEHGLVIIRGIVLDKDDIMKMTQMLENKPFPKEDFLVTDINYFVESPLRK